MAQDHIIHTWESPYFQNNRFRGSTATSFRAVLTKKALRALPPLQPMSNSADRETHPHLWAHKTPRTPPISALREE